MLNLTTWRPITLHHTTYKIFTKALQWYLQPLLVKIIDNDQTTFLPLALVLNNTLLTHKSIQWAKELRQDAIFFNFDLAKHMIKFIGPSRFKLWRR